MVKTPEGNVKDNIKKWLKKWVPSFWYYMPVHTGWGEHGIPDYVGCLPVKVTHDMVGKEIGLFVTIEAKKPKPKGKLTQYQADKKIEIVDARGLYLTVFGSVSIEETLRVLSQLQNNLKNDLSTQADESALIWRRFLGEDE